MKFICLKTHHNGKTGKEFKIIRKGVEREAATNPNPKLWKAETPPAPAEQ